ncbi:MAG TPA: TolC family protein [Turneriella sp.]|nr:TolC family protein [Turneriella sp.]HMY10057.1 TolC family protein [Turneriella sp.]HNL11533.1 TolC family protein [Turneriella sp.]HNM99975.1 TolC family protein [Turneriella sp.]
MNVFAKSTSKHLLALVALLLFRTTGIAAEKPIRFSEGLTQLLKNNAKILGSKAQILSFEAIRTEASASDLPTLSFLSYVAPIYEVRGDATRSVDNFSKWGPFLHGELQVVYPVFSFGRIKDAKQAASHAVEGGRFLHESQINKSIFEFKQLYMQCILLNRLRSVLDDANDKMKTILGHAEKLYKKGTGEVQRKDLTRLRLFALELQRFNAEWHASKKTAGLALGHFLGEKESLLVLEQDFPRIQEATRALEQLIAEAHLTNPDLKAVTEGMQARHHQLEMEKGGNLPILFVAGRADMNYTNMRDYQQSTYAFDPFNRNIFAVVFGAKWDLDFGNTKAKIQKAEAELEKMKAMQSEAETGIPLKIAMAMWEFEKQKIQMEIAQNKFKEANKWSLSEMTAYTAGTGNAKDLIEALGAMLMTEKEMAESEFNLCIAAARLAMEIGDQSTLKSWQE